MQDLARMSLVKSANKNSVDYNDLANIVDQQETLQFLQGSLCCVVISFSAVIVLTLIGQKEGHLACNNTATILSKLG